MSLPSQAIFYDKDGNHMDNVFINVGWFFNPESLARQLDEIECPVGWEMVVLYGERFTRAEIDEFMIRYQNWESMQRWMSNRYKEKK